MGLYSLYIVNSSGTLIYQRNLQTNLPKLDDNDYIRIGSTFHTLNAMAKQAAPVVSGGIDTLYTDTFAMKCLETRTGFTFFLLADRRAPDSDLSEVLSAVYRDFSDSSIKIHFTRTDKKSKLKNFKRE